MCIPEILPFYMVTYQTVYELTLNNFSKYKLGLKLGPFISNGLDFFSAIVRKKLYDNIL